MAACELPDKSPAETGLDCVAGSVETCNGLDDDCDGLTDEDAVDQRDWYMDRDGDGYGIAGATLRACDAGGLFVAEAGDCDDDDAAVHPGAIEDPCTETRDLDCDGLVQPADADADGWSACDDCDEADASIHPEATDPCDGLDQDCDGLADEDAATTVWYVDGDGDGAGDSTVMVEACAAPTGYVAVGDDCDDADAGRAPSLLEVCDDGVDQNCSGSDLTCGIWADSSLVSTPIRIYGDDAGWVVGTSVRFVGDVSGDGNIDLLVGASQASLVAYRGGAAFLVSSIVEGDHLLGDVFAASMAGEGYNNQLGFSVAPLGDPDGDGYADVIVGAPFADGVTASTGAAYVVFGPWTEELRATEADVVLPGETDGAGWTGYALDNAGDVNGDGIDDVILSAPFAYNLDRFDGEAYIVFGPPSNVGLRHADVQIMPQTGGGELGTHVVGAGDMDGDGAAEVIVGWYTTNYYHAAGGAAVILSDVGAGLASVPNEGVGLYDDETGCLNSGSFVGAAGDTDGDGYADALIGESQSVDNDALAGAVYLVHGPVTDDMPLADADSQLLGVNASEFAERGTGGGDIDADGYPDIIVGASYSGASLALGGTVYVLHGPIASGSLSLADADAILTGESAEDYAGYWAAIDGDQNGDGYDDLLIGAPFAEDASTATGAVYLLYGGPP